MPLHAEHKAAIGQFDRFRKIVGYGPSGDRQPFTDAINSLMMMLHRRVEKLTGDRGS